jgi:8-oxo-dGTP diphosphatase
LACINENIVEFDGKKGHDCTLLHWCSIEYSKIGDFIVHNEHPEIKLTWRTFEQLKQKPLYPEGILDFLVKKLEPIFHLVIRKNYD